MWYFIKFKTIISDSNNTLFLFSLATHYKMFSFGLLNFLSTRHISYVFVSVNVCVCVSVCNHVEQLPPSYVLVCGVFSGVWEGSKNCTTPAQSESRPCRASRTCHDGDSKFSLCGHGKRNGSDRREHVAWCDTSHGWGGRFAERLQWLGIVVLRGRLIRRHTTLSVA